MSPQSIAILGAAGPTGRHLAPLLLERGHRVRAVGRTEARLTAAFSGAGVEIHAADLSDPDAAARALDGQSLAFLCVGTPMGAAQAEHPRIARAVASAAGRTGTRIVHVSNTWSYLPLQTLPLREDHPREGGPEPARLRREAEDILRQDADACIAHLPDFYGPYVHSSSVQRALVEGLRRNGGMRWIGNPHNAREYAYVPDAMRCVAELSRHPEAFGAHWLIPGGPALTARDLARFAAMRTGRPVGVMVSGRTTLRLAGLFSRTVRDFLPMVPSYMQPITIDASRLTALIGPPALTDPDVAILNTLDWIRDAGVY